MNWQAWSSILDQSIVAITCIGVIPVIGRILHNIMKPIKKEEPERLHVGDRIKMQITDPMVIEEIQILEERQDLTEEKIIAYEHKLDMLNTELEGEFNSDKIVRLELEIVNVELNINKLKQQSDDLSAKIDRIGITKGTPIV